MDSVRILLVDDHSLVRDGIKALLEEEEKYYVIGEAATGAEGIEKVRLLNPDLIICDIRMPKLSGIEAVRQLRQDGHTVKIIMLSMHDSEEYILQSIQVGADGYLLKDASKEEFLKAVGSVLDGHKYFSGDVSDILVNTLTKNLITPDEISLPTATEKVDRVKTIKSAGLNSKDPFDLTKRERQILELAVSGNSNKEIASALNISKRTTEVHRFNLMKKMQVKNVVDLTNKARAYNLI